MSVKPCSSNSEHSHSADSTSASAVARPYLASRRLSSEPALTPILIGIPARRRGPGDLRDLVVERLDVAGVDPDRAAAGVDGGEHVLRLEVNVGDHRDLRLTGDFRQRVGVVLRRHRDPDDLAAGRGQLGDLLQRGVHVGGHRGAHRLHRHRGAAAHRDRVLALAHHDLARLAPRRQGSAAGCGMPRSMLMILVPHCVLVKGVLAEGSLFRCLHHVRPTCTNHRLKHPGGPRSASPHWGCAPG